eukprot:m.83580 g.83580  ORF g.83580 m.83580 type:complete len:1030 (+) comp12928_c0_seq3:208-3297(+)
MIKIFNMAETGLLVDLEGDDSNAQEKNTPVIKGDTNTEQEAWQDALVVSLGGPLAAQGNMNSDAEPTDTGNLISDHRNSDTSAETAPSPGPVFGSGGRRSSSRDNPFLQSKKSAQLTESDNEDKDIVSPLVDIPGAGAAMAVGSSPEHKNSFKEMMKRGLTSDNFDVSQNIASKDKRDVASDAESFLRAIMKERQCSFDEARLYLVMEQMKKAGVVEEEEQLTSMGGAPIMEQVTKGYLHRWNHHRVAVADKDVIGEATSWSQLEIALTVHGVDCEGYSQTKSKMRERRQNQQSFFTKMSRRISSRGDSNAPAVGGCYLKVLRSEEVFPDGRMCHTHIRDSVGNFKLLQCTEKVPTAETVSYKVTVLTPIPPAPKVISLMFQFWVELGGIETFVAEARCGCSELAESPQYTIMLASTLAGTADSKLELSSRLSEQQMDIPTLRNTCWAAQGYVLPTELRFPAIVREELTESLLAFEVPAKFLKFRSEDMSDELAMLQGKIGEVRSVMANQDVIPADMQEYSLDFPHWEQERLDKTRTQIVNMLEDVMYKTAGMMRDYAQLHKYYTDCYTVGSSSAKPAFAPITTKKSVKRKDSALRAVATNLHVHTVCLKDPVELFGSRTKSWTSKAHHTITCGAPAAHAFGFSEGGLAAMLDRMRTLRREKQMDTGSPVDPVCPLYLSSAAVIQSLYTSDETVADIVSDMNSEISLARLTFDTRRRMDAVLGQALAVAATAFSCRVSEILTTNDFASLECIYTFGFLFSVESLLSTAGTEYKIIRDLEGALEIMQEFCVIYLAKRPADKELCETVVFEKLSGLRGFSMTMYISSKEHAMLPPQLQTRAEEPIHLVPLLFTQGVNAFQTISNLVGTSKLQQALNRDALLVLRTYAQGYIHFQSEFPREDMTNSMASVSEMLHILDNFISNAAAKKEHEVLCCAADCVRLIGGARVTCCKSGKDRTSQAVTLEVVRFLSQEYGLQEELPLANLMREHGVRRSNVFKNTGGFSYNFNAIQARSLPASFRPPTSTLTTVTTK